MKKNKRSYFEKQKSLTSDISDNIDLLLKSEAAEPKLPQ